MVEAPAPVVVELHDRADVVLGDDRGRTDVGLLDQLDLARHLGRVVHLELLPGLREDAVGDVRSRHEQVEVELALESLAHDLHVQEAEEPAAEPEAERLRGLRLVEERGVVELQLLERVAKRRIVVRVGREQPREHGRLHVLVAGERLGGGLVLGRQRVADAQAADLLQARDDVADLAGLEGRASGSGRARRTRAPPPRSACLRPSRAGAARVEKRPSTIRTKATTPRYWS